MVRCVGVGGFIQVDTRFLLGQQAAQLVESPRLARKRHPLNDTPHPVNRYGPGFTQSPAYGPGITPRDDIQRQQGFLLRLMHHATVHIALGALKKKPHHAIAIPLDQIRCHPAVIAMDIARIGTTHHRMTPEIAGKSAQFSRSILERQHLARGVGQLRLCRGPVRPETFGQRRRILVVFTVQPDPDTQRLGMFQRGLAQIPHGVNGGTGNPVVEGFQVGGIRRTPPDVRAGAWSAVGMGTTHHDGFVHQTGGCPHLGPHLMRDAEVQPHQVTTDHHHRGPVLFHGHGPRPEPVPDPDGMPASERSEPAQFNPHPRRDILPAESCFHANNSLIMALTLSTTTSSESGASLAQ